MHNAIQILEYKQMDPTFAKYDPEAAVAAQCIIDSIQLEYPRLRIEHIGSSAVSGCSGKGYIDLLVMYEDGDLEAAKQTLAALGFQPQRSRDPFPEERPMRVGCILHKGRLYPVHAHVVAASSPEVEELIWFRDRLRSDPGLRADYERDKQRILAEGVIDGADYAEKKNGFIRGLLAKRKGEQP